MTSTTTPLSELARDLLTLVDPPLSALPTGPSHPLPQPIGTPTLGTVLFVCTGNVSRSAYMELQFRALCQDAGLENISICSAGTEAATGRAPHEKVLRRVGMLEEPFQASQLTAEDVAAADLVITATRRQRDSVGLIAPQHRTKLFTLLQLQRLLGDDLTPLPEATGTAAARLAQLALSRRGSHPSAGSGDDVADPTGRGGGAFNSAFNILDGALQGLIDGLLACSTANDAWEN